MVLILAFISLVTMTQSSLAQQGPTQCHDPTMTSWMLNSEGENPCQVLQDVMRVCNPSYDIDWLTPSYSCDNSPTSITAACCCGSPTFALFSACWSCQYNYTMDIVSTTFTSFEKDCTPIPTPLTSYDPIIRSLVDQIDIPLWAKMEPSAAKWDLTAAWRNATPEIPTAAPPIPTSYPMSTSNTLSSGALIGIIVGSVLGTSLTFILAALIFWRCLLAPNRSRLRQQDDDIRIGQNMGYLDGEYIYVRPETLPDGSLEPNGRRFILRRDTHLRPRAELDLDASDCDVSRGPSDYDDDTLGRPLRAHSHSEARSSYFGSARARSPSYADPPSPYSPARHASLDGRYRGYHPAASPILPQEESRYEPPRRSRDHRSSRGEHDRREYHDPEYRHSSNRPRGPISRHFSHHRPSADRFSAHHASTHRQHNSRASADQYSASHRSRSRSHSRSRPTSGHSVNRRPISGQFSGLTTRPLSGQFSDHRTSVERRHDRRVSVRSGLRHASFDSTQQNRDTGPMFWLDDVWGTRDGRRDGRFSRDGGPGGGRSRDVHLKASLSEGDEDREREGQDDGEGEGESSTDEDEVRVGPPPRRSEATGSEFGRCRHQQHLRKRSQSARTSCDADVVTQDHQDVDSKSRHTPVSATTPLPTTSNAQSSGTRYKPPRSPLFVTNPNSDSEMRPPSAGTSILRPPVIREPGLLARARVLLSARSSRSSSSGHRNQEPASAPAPPSAWQQRLPSVLLRNRSGSTIAQRRSSDSAHGSDVTSVYHTAHGHPSGAGTPMTEVGFVAGPSSRSRATIAHASDEASYRQEVDAGVQLVVESSSQTPVTTERAHEVGPPAYVDSRPRPESHLRSGPVLDSADPNRLSTVTHETVLSGDWDSTVSSGEIQTWMAARHPTGFVGTGRVITSEMQMLRTSREASASMQDVSSTAVSTTDSDEEDHEDKIVPESLTLDSHKSDGSRETETEVERA